MSCFLSPADFLFTSPMHVVSQRILPILRRRRKKPIAVCQVGRRLKAISLRKLGTRYQATTAFRLGRPLHIPPCTVEPVVLSKTRNDDALGGQASAAECVPASPSQAVGCDSRFGTVLCPLVSGASSALVGHCSPSSPLNDGPFTPSPPSADSEGREESPCVRNVAEGNGLRVTPLQAAEAEAEGKGNAPCHRPVAQIVKGVGTMGSLLAGHSKTRPIDLDGEGKSEGDSGLYACCKHSRCVRGLPRNLQGRHLGRWCRLLEAVVRAADKKGLDAACLTTCPATGKSVNRDQKHNSQTGLLCLGGAQCDVQSGLQIWVRCTSEPPPNALPTWNDGSTK